MLEPDPRTGRRRLILLLLGAAAWMGLILVRLLSVQVLEVDAFRNLASRQQTAVVEITAPRGAILDRDGRELALSRSVKSFYAVPAELANPAQAAAQLAKALRVDRRPLERRLRLKDRDFVWVARKLIDSDAARVEALGIKGLGSLDEPRRFYPRGTLAAHVLGYVGLDNTGLAGVEHLYDQQIRGTPGRQLTLRDARGLRFLPEPGGKPAQAGASAILTLDAVVQYLVETALADAVRTSRAKDGVAVALDPRTGEVLAAVSWPTYDPNDYARYGQDAWRDNVVGSAYEPGSTFKLVTLASALEDHKLRLSERIDCLMGGIRIGNHRFEDHKPFGVLAPIDIFAQSSNVGAIEIGQRLTPRSFYDHMLRFGLGKPTDIDLPGEARGLVRDPREWSGLSQAAMSFGQEVSVTPIQLAVAFAAVANKGIAMKPYVVQRIVASTGETLYQRQPEAAGRVVTASTAAIMLDMMKEVVRTGTARTAQLAGYTAAGKTGTAQKIGPDGGGYLQGRYIASFVGVAPAADPRFLLFVALDEPEGPYHGGEVAAPVFRAVAQPALAHLGVAPETPELVADITWRDYFPPAAATDQTAAQPGVVYAAAGTR